MIEQEKTKMSSGKKTVLAVVAIGLLVIGYFGYRTYNTYLSPNVSGSEKYLYIKTGSSINDLFASLEKKNLLKDVESFKTAASKMKLASSLKPGRYALKTSYGNRVLINMIKSGNQEAVKLKIHNIRKKENFAAYLAQNLEVDSLSFITAIDSLQLISKYGFNQDNIYAMFIPNTYEVNWNTQPVVFMDRMHKEYEKFWNAERKQKAASLNLTPIQVDILASIVDAEALYDKEMPIIAGLYLNRLNKGILLQADPTVIFANDDFTVKRVTGKLLQIQSLYNTYKYAGLPPGPIMMPSINAIDAVLNREQNDYIYMCAKDDFSGYHNFASTKEQHSINAKKYREALNKRNIFK
ncbi:endolytic transglycosylase MltG [Pedobacter changchengzhani]|uniref:Endolytic murein transglycosylase n=1 Tax=Pedobacter changchengzhani TaxID=2529274 RepID=A0A4R5MK63_9SPHI|nr:endolytic transglycosylase MltG [Pedobacter changchengzhani]TDG35796.1 endolytic transglycosylase MltG [Pedobacter changchengzhani]